LKQAPARLASDHADAVLRTMHTKAQAKGSSPLEKKEQKETREEHACKIIHAKFMQKEKKTLEQLPALLPPKDGHTPTQQAVQEGRFAQALAKATTRWATAKREKDNLPQTDTKKSESSSVIEQKEGFRGTAMAVGQCPCDPKKKRTYKEALAACKERWTRHKEGREDIYTDLPFADKIDNPFELKKVVLSKKKALNIPITFSSTQGSKTGRALIDSGATENFIDDRTARRWELPTRNLVYPRKVFNVDGTENCNGMIVKSCMLRVHCGEKQACQRFYIMDLGDDRILLGYPWLEEFNPDIDWKAGAMKGPQIELEVTSLAWRNWQQGQAVIKIAQMEPEWEAGDELIICKTHFTQDWAIVEWARKGKDKEVTVADLGIPNEYK
jgi:gag-polyprotein putative aspartyl protease